MTDIQKETRRVLDQNWVEGELRGVPFGYTQPSPGYYPYQWYWDSCFVAIAQRHWRPDRAREELRSLVRAQRDDGFIPHTIFWTGRVRLSRVAFYNLRRLTDWHTATIQPPLLGWAWELVAKASGDGAAEFIEEGIEPLARHYDWLARERDLDGDGLISIIQPDECGLDHSPKFDDVPGFGAWGKAGQAVIISRNRRLGFNAFRVAERHGDQVKEVLTNVLYARGLRALGRMDFPGATRYAARAGRVTKRLLELCYDERDGLFYDRVGAEGRPLRVNTWSSVSPLSLPDLPKDIAHRLVEHLMNQNEYRTPVPIPSVAASEPSFVPGESSGIVNRYWRGPSWVNTSWLIVKAMRRLGYEEEADTLLRPLRDAVSRHGLREYYDAHTGEGLGARDFGWSALMATL